MSWSTLAHIQLWLIRHVESVVWCFCWWNHFYRIAAALPIGVQFLDPTTKPWYQNSPPQHTPSASSIPPPGNVARLLNHQVETKKLGQIGSFFLSYKNWIIFPYGWGENHTFFELPPGKSTNIPKKGTIFIGNFIFQPSIMQGIC